MSSIYDKSIKVLGELLKQNYEGTLESNLYVARVHLTTHLEEIGEAQFLADLKSAIDVTDDLDTTHFDVAYLLALLSVVAFTLRLEDTNNV